MIDVLDSLRQAVSEMAVQGTLPGSLEYAFVFNALVCAMIVGPVLGGLGTMVVVKRMAFFSQAVGNAALTGVAIGILLGEPYTAPYASLFGFCILFGLAMTYTRNVTRMSQDTLIGVFLSISLALGACLLLSVANKISVHILDNVLFGSVLTVDDTDIAVLAGIAVLTATVGLSWYNRMLLASFNPGLAMVRGIPARLADYAFVLLVTVVTVASVKIVGAVLVEALLLIPAAASRNISRSVRGFFFWSVAFATISCLAGTILPMELDLPVPSGGAIILAATCIFLATMAIRATASRFAASA